VTRAIVPACVLIVAVEHSDIPAFDDRPGLIAGALEFTRWLMAPQGGGVDLSAVRLLLSAAVVPGAARRVELPADLGAAQPAAEATLANLERAVDDLAAKFDPNHVIVYWAGHGVLSRSADPASHQLATVDCRLGLPNLLAWLGERLAPSSLGNVALIDTCREGPAASAARLGKEVKLPVAQAEGTLPSKQAVFSACAPNERAFVRSGAGGEFTLRMLEVLEGLEPDGPWLTARRLALVRERIGSSIPSSGQHPSLWLTDWSDDATIRSYGARPSGLDPAVWDELLRRAARCDARVTRNAFLSVYDQVLDTGGPRPPAGIATFSDFVAYLGGCVAEDPAAPHQVLRLLYTLAKQAKSGPDTGLEEFLAWLDRESWFGRRRELEDRYSESAAGRDQPTGSYLVVQVRPPTRPVRGAEAGAPRTYLFHAWLYLSGGCRRIAVGDDRPIPVGSIERRLVDLLTLLGAGDPVAVVGVPGVDEYVALDAQQIRELTVEVILPRTLLGLRIGDWELYRGIKLGNKHPVQVRDGLRLWDRSPEMKNTAFEVETRRRTLAQTGELLSARHTGWITCETVDGDVEGVVRRLPFTMFTYPPFQETGDGEFRVCESLDTALAAGGVALFWPDEPCPINHQGPNVWSRDLVARMCHGYTTPDSYETILNQAGCDPRPRYFVRDLRLRPHDSVPRLPRMNLLYDDGVRIPEGPFVSAN
jgi:vWA-MoxR associated protein C-terminal domain/Caspase domain